MTFFLLGVLSGHAFSVKSRQTDLQKLNLFESINKKEITYLFYYWEIDVIVLLVPNI